MSEALKKKFLQFYNKYRREFDDINIKEKNKIPKDLKK